MSRSSWGAHSHVIIWMCSAQFKRLFEMLNRERWNQCLSSVCWRALHCTYHLKQSFQRLRKELNTLIDRFWNLWLDASSSSYKSTWILTSGSNYGTPNPLWLLAEYLPFFPHAGCHSSLWKLSLSNYISVQLIFFLYSIIVTTSRANQYNHWAFHCWVLFHVTIHSECIPW